MKVICDNCGKEHNKKPYRFKSHKHHFCSCKCMSEWNWGNNNPNWAGGRVKRVCNICGEEFYVRPYVSRKEGMGKYCSYACLHIGQKKPSIRKVCLQCGKDFYIASQKPKNKRFCNTACSDKWHGVNMRRQQNHKWTGRVIKYCEMCKKEIEVSPYKIKKNESHFCSNTCRMVGLLRKQGNHKTGIEKRFESICIKNSLPLKYTGMGSFWIGNDSYSLNPDFVDINGRKICVEINGEFWHSPLINHRIDEKRTVAFKKRHYKKYGWKMIVFWETDMNRGDAEAFVLYQLRKEKVIK